MNPTILVVDDAAALHTMLRMFLKQDEYRVVAVEPGSTALNVARDAARDTGILGLLLLQANNPDSAANSAASVNNLVARVQAALPHTKIIASDPAIVRAADIILHREDRVVWVGDRTVDLTPAEFTILQTLLAAPGQVFSRRELLYQVSGAEHSGCTRTIDVHIRNLRTKIEANPKHPVYIETIYRIGYRFAIPK